jgi:DNA-binding NarL/FixJ family response regulator
MHRVSTSVSGAPAAAAHPHLSPRQEEVLRLVAWGYTNKEVAAKLNMSVKTVETHKANVAQKMGLRSRIEIVQFAFHHGWLASL